MKDQFTKAWIKSTAIPIIARYEPGVLTLRGLYYQLVSCGMTNSLNHYKRVVSAMIDARWDGEVDFEAFSDHRPRDDRRDGLRGHYRREQSCRR